MPGLDEFIKFAFTGVIGYAYIALNIIGIIGHRKAAWSETRTFYAVGIVGAAAGCLNGVAGAVAQFGPDSLAISNSGLICAIIGACASNIGSLGSVALDRFGVAPQTDQKKYNEAVLDPRDPTQPTGQVTQPPPPPPPPGT